nr:hypothetical protein [Tanacetum cinerariifolium]
MRSFRSASSGYSKSLSLVILYLQMASLWIHQRSKENTKCVSAAGEELTAAKHKLILLYFLMTDYSLWEVILNGDSPVSTRLVKGVAQPVAPTMVEQKLARKNELKAQLKNIDS